MLTVSMYKLHKCSSIYVHITYELMFESFGKCHIKRRALFSKKKKLIDIFYINHNNFILLLIIKHFNRIKMRKGRVTRWRYRS